MMFAIFALPFSSYGADKDLVKTVRIASIGYFDQGRLHVGGSQSSALNTYGWLEKDLEKRGVKVEWVPVSPKLGGPGFNELLASNAVDFASYADFSAIIARAGGVPLKLVVPAGRGGNSYIIVQAGSPIKSVAELKGKTIALQRGQDRELAFAQLVASLGLSYGDFKIVNTSASAAYAAVVGGKVDAALGGAEAFLLEDKNVARIIWSTKGTNWKWRAELFAREEFLEENPQIAQIVVNAYVRSAHWSSQEENRDRVLEFISRNGTPLSVIDRDFDEILRWQDRWSPLFDKYMTQHYAAAVDFAYGNDMIRNKFSVEDFFEPKYVANALAALNLEDFWTPRDVADVAPAPTLH